MCGLFGYIGPKKPLGDCVSICMNGLKQLEYRGYDSSGIAGIFNGEIKSCKRAGKVETLQQAIHSQKVRLDIAIAHTRWATHGIPSQENAHPHIDEENSLAIVHNGIIENHLAIRAMLKKQGFTFQSDTDSEVIAQLISYHYKGNLIEAVQKALLKLKGSLAIAVIHKHFPEQIIAAARESPLVIGHCKENEEVFLSSDANTFSGRNLDVFYLQDDEVALLHQNAVSVFDRKGKPLEKILEHICFDNSPISKNGYKHYMLKEIFEQPQTIQQAMHSRYSEDFGTAEFDELTLCPKELQSINRILILACGTSWHAGSIARSMMESIARIPTEVEIASEFRYTNPIVSENTLVIAISQSGETADTLAAVREAKAKGAKILAFCNVDHSSISREADSCIFLKAGKEISVCSTKAFTSQLTLIALFTLYMARLRHMSKEEGQKFLQDLKTLPMIVTQVLSQAKTIENLAKKYASYEHFFFLGRRYMFPASLEAALKLKEISYLNATGHPAGEMKHGSIALISDQLAVIGMCGNMQTFDKMLSNLMEVKSRGGPILAFAPKGCNEIKTVADDVLWLPTVPDYLASIPYSVAAQLLAYYIAKIRGTDIDQPRNLAKSVTVE